MELEVAVQFCSYTPIFNQTFILFTYGEMEKKEKKSELKWLSKKQQKNVNETLELLRKYYPNLEIDKVDLEKGRVHLKGGEKN